MSPGHPAAELADRQLMYRRARRSARIALTNELLGQVCLDEEDLISRAGPCGTHALDRLTHRRLAARALAAEGIGVEAIARAWGETPQQVHELIAAPLIDPERRFDKIDLELRVQHSPLEDE